MLQRRIALVGCAASLATLLPATASAYCRTTTADPERSACPGICQTEGVPLRWNTTELTYAINTSGFPGLDDGALSGLFAASFATWSAVTCDGTPLPLKFSEAPRTPARESRPEGDTPLENENVFAYLTAEEWRARGESSAAYAITGVWYDTKTGEIVGADMMFNGGMGLFGVCPDEGCPPGGRLRDLQNVATHEIGHFLGLSHSDVPGATMWCGAAPSEIEKRTLEADDIAGICAAYPSDSTFERDLRYHGSGGCSAEPPSRGALGWLAALALLVVRALARRRSPRHEGAPRA